MDAFLWSQPFFTGFENVDAQHRRLVELINELGGLMADGDEMSEGRMQILFKQLADYAREHFREEEDLMRSAGIDGRHIEQHVRHHHEFVEQLASLWRTRKSMSHPAATVHGFLTAWLAYHILGEDQAMARQITRVRGGEAPEIAYELDEQPAHKGMAVLLQALQISFHLIGEQHRDLDEATRRLLKEQASHRG
jgi:hemerythrin-like metal-binding protein